MADERRCDMCACEKKAFLRLVACQIIKGAAIIEFEMTFCGVDCLQSWMTMRAISPPPKTNLMQPLKGHEGEKVPDVLNGKTTAEKTGNLFKAMGFPSEDPDDYS